ncbi:MAG: ATP-dependent zinc metalloprotease FtsH [Clostridia bacterium]|nr:ATP-dependent zinc metalloprotease FtsH [Clostridia bacterium]
MKSSAAKGIVAFILILMCVVGAVYFFNEYSGTEVTYDKFLDYLLEGKYDKVTVNGYYSVKAEYKEDGRVLNHVANIPNRDIFRADYDKYREIMEGEIAKYKAVLTDPDQIDNYIANKAALEKLEALYDKVFDPDLIKYGSMNTSSVWEYLIYGVFILGTVFLVIYVIRQIGKQNQQGVQFSKSRARVYRKVSVRFTDVAGCDEEKEELVEVVDFLKNPKRYDEIGARIPKGVLLVGPPGTGKTLLAKAVAGEAGVPFFSISGSDFVEMYVGVGASRVRDLFDQAKRSLPCIIFIDEIDAVGRQRGAGLGGGHDEREQTLNQILIEMDGFEGNLGIVIIAATNRQDILDPALLRPGRFDRQVYVAPPDVKGREAILKIHARNKQFTTDVSFQTVAKITAGFTGADLENLLNEAAIYAVRNGRKQINMNDINEAVNKVTMGPAKKSRLVTPRDKRITAYHESGHAIVCSLLPDCPEVHEVTIIPRGNAGGFTSFKLDNDDMFLSKNQLLNRVAFGLGGRAAEEIILESFTTGASNDIKQVTAYAHKMVVEWGMSEELGPIYFGSEGEVFLGKTYQNRQSYSEAVAAIIDKEECKIVREGYQKAKELLNANMQILHNFAKVLLEVETIHEDSIKMLLKGEDPKRVIDTENAENAEIVRRNELELRQSQRESEKK